MKPFIYHFFWLSVLIMASCDGEKSGSGIAVQSVFTDVPFIQDYSVKYYSADKETVFTSIISDRNGHIAILGEHKLWFPFGGQFQQPGTISADVRYKPMLSKRLKAMISYDEQAVYLDDKAILSNAWAGKLYIGHTMKNASLLAGAPGFRFLVSNGTQLHILEPDKTIWEGSMANEEIHSIQFDSYRNCFWLQSDKAVYQLSPDGGAPEAIFTIDDLRCLGIGKDALLLGTANGYAVAKPESRELSGLNQKLPWPALTVIREIDGKWWLGSEKGAFMLREDGRFNYYHGERWLPGNFIHDISSGPEGSVLILTDKGLGQLHFQYMTLHEKAMRYEAQVRRHHIRYGFNCDVPVLLEPGNLATLQLGPKESDNLWTAMYLGSQIFRYLVTGEEEAFKNISESFDAMERLFHITDIDGFFARGFERRGIYDYKQSSIGEGYAAGWVPSSHDEWDWKGTTSSDQTVGQMFVLTLLAEHFEGDIKERAITLMDKLMTHIMDNDWYLIDVDGKPTLWGKWNPDYVNNFPVVVGDRKLYSSNLIGFLQTVYHFTGKEIYKDKAYELMEKHGYLENLMRPFSEIGAAPDDADDWSKMLSKEWNHSDDEMYFLAYWSLYPYAFDDGLKSQYFEAIKDHWEVERPEKNALWNFCFAMTGARDFDLEESIWFLQEFPLDMIEFGVENSHRQDIEMVEPNHWGQTTAEILPPDERPELKHNRNLFKLDRPGKGHSMQSPGDTWLLPYWMGRYLGVIEGPEK
ncbi:MAG: hypothetical protein JJU28_17845 [Cyclobacteriaceae bacterium]|nr:hypothetical protein [Cyclobacteriaceae bacterium]